MERYQAMQQALQQPQPPFNHDARMAAKMKRNVVEQGILDVVDSLPDQEQPSGSKSNYPPISVDRLTLLSAFRHYREGQGQKVAVPISSVFVNPRDIVSSTEFQTQVSSILRQPPPKNNVKAVWIPNISYKTYEDDGQYYIYGHIKVDVKGQITYHKDGTWTLQGKILPSSYNDGKEWPDFNRAQRSFRGELATSFGRKTPGTNYWIKFYDDPNNPVRTLLKGRWK